MPEARLPARSVLVQRLTGVLQMSRVLAQRRRRRRTTTTTTTKTTWRVAIRAC
jgi:hypothetical protein